MLAALIIAVMVMQVEAPTSDTLAVHPTADLATQVHRLVRKLDAPESEARDGAEKQLMDLGPAVVDYLPEKAEGDREFEERLTRIREKFAAQLETEKMAKASKLTLVGDYTAEQLWEEIDKQTGNKIVDHRRNAAPEAKMHLDLKDVDFWPGIDSIVDNIGGSTFSKTASEGLELLDARIQIVPRTKDAIYVGPLRLRVNRLSEVRDLDENGPGSLTINLIVEWEPRLRPLMFSQDAKEIHAVDDRGGSLVLPNLIHDVAVNGNTLGIQTGISMVAPNGRWKRSRHLRGNFAARSRTSRKHSSSRNYQRQLVFYPWCKRSDRRR